MEALTTYKTFKQNLDNELNRAAEGFVKIGYLLKLARDNPHILPAVDIRISMKWQIRSMELIKQ